MKHRERVAFLLSTAWKNGCITQFPENITITYDKGDLMWTIQYNGAKTVFDDWNTAAEWLNDIMENPDRHHPEQITKKADWIRRNTLEIDTSKTVQYARSISNYILGIYDEGE